jgi:predicted Zn-ribbon and HTH transcriptional regulator
MGYTNSNILFFMAKVKLLGFRCERCEHEWLPRDKDQEPLVCPKCKSPYWNRPRKTANAKRGKK